MSTLFDTDPRAELSDCGRYRYVLRRRWGIGGQPILFVGLNPSTADAEQDDPTVRRMVGFAETWGAPAMELVNLYALRATDPKSLRVAPTPVGAENDAAIAAAAARARFAVVCWGSTDAPERDARVRGVYELLLNGCGDIRCLKVTKDGHPWHPLYVPATALPNEWRPRG